jgi:hypothetical protein
MHFYLFMIQTAGFKCISIERMTAGISGSNSLERSYSTYGCYLTLRVRVVYSVVAESGGWVQRLAAEPVEACHFARLLRPFDRLRVRYGSLRYRYGSLLRPFDKLRVRKVASVDTESAGRLAGRPRRPLRQPGQCILPSLYQRLFLFPAPALHLFLSKKGIIDALKRFVVYQSHWKPFPGVIRSLARVMLLQPHIQLAGAAGIPILFLYLRLGVS